MHNPSVIPTPNECCQSLKEQTDGAFILRDTYYLFLILCKMTSHKGDLVYF